MAMRPRRLSAILHADIEGYVRLMEGDEERTVDRLQTVRAEIWRPAIEVGGGSVVNIEGDSVLAEFGSAAAAVAAAIDIQERMALFNALLEENQRLMFRIGLHLGEVIVDEKTRSIFGDGVNLAARIQAIAEPGGIAVSRALRERAEVRSDYGFVDGGEHWAKNVSRPLQIYRVRLRSGAAIRAGIRKPGALARVARLGRSARVTIRGPALWGAAAALTLLVAGGGYFAYHANVPATVSAAALSLSAEQLEQALAERRMADALTLEKRQLETEARQRAAVGAEAKRQAEEELERARQARQKAEDALAKLRADIAARRQSDTGGQAETALRRTAEEAAQRKAELEAASLRQAEEEAKVKASADAEAKRQADDALATAEAERQRAEREAQRKAEAEQAALTRASEEVQRQAAIAEGKRQANEKEARTEADAAARAALARQKEESEAAEKGLRLDQTARAHLQVALTSLGFDTRGSDGIVGPRTREMIAAWQKARNQPATGFVDAAQRQMLLKEAVAAVSRYDEQKKSEEEEASRPTPFSPAVSAVPTVSTTSQFDGRYSGGVLGGVSTGMKATRIEINEGRGSGSIDIPGCGTARFTLAISPTARVTGRGLTCELAAPFSVTGHVVGDRLFLKIQGYGSGGDAQLSRSAGLAAAPSRIEVAAAPERTDEGTAFARYDGTYSGPINDLHPSSRAALTLRMANGKGSITLDSFGCSPSHFAIAISANGAVSGEGELKCIVLLWGAGTGSISAGLFRIDGRYQGREVRLTFRSNRNSFAAVLK